MVLVDYQIIDEVVDKDMIIPFDPDLVQPSSYDLTLGRRFLWISYEDEGEVIAYDDVPQYEVIELTGRNDTIDLEPGEFCLAHTEEIVDIPASLSAIVAGKSTWARKGLTIHQTAGWIDPGFSGRITLELKNVGTSIIQLKIGDPIAQLVLMKNDKIPLNEYNGRYQGAEHVEGAKPLRRNKEAKKGQNKRESEANRISR
jgi:dCTP deaminase